MAVLHVCPSCHERRWLVSDPVRDEMHCYECGKSWTMQELYLRDTSRSKRITPAPKQGTRRVRLE